MAWITRKLSYKYQFQYKDTTPCVKQSINQPEQSYNAEKNKLKSFYFCYKLSISELMNIKTYET